MYVVIIIKAKRKREVRVGETLGPCYLLDNRIFVGIDCTFIPS